MSITLPQIALALFVAVLVLVTTLGNLLVCYAVLKDSRLHRVENVFLVSLAVSDLLVAVLVMPPAGINDVYGLWLFGSLLCDCWIATDIMCSTASIFNLCAIALERYIHIKDPFRYARLVTKKIVVSAVLIIWTLSAAISALPISLGLHRSSSLAGSSHLSKCAIDFSPTYAVISTLVSFCLPCVVMISMYYKLYTYSQIHQRHIAKLFPTIPQPPKAAVTIGVVIGVFLICWTPYFAASSFAAFCKGCVPPIVFKVFSWLGYSNSLFDPIIYSVLNSEFRQAFKLILRRKLAAEFSTSLPRSKTESSC